MAGVTTIGGSRVGKQIISFKDGGLISIKDPAIEIQGLLSDRTHVLVGKLEITDHINKLVATVTYNPSQDNSTNSNGSGIGILKSFKIKFFK